jgi:rod shape-determining protein MreD
MRILLCLMLGLVLLIVQGLLRHVGVPGWAIPQGLLICVAFLAFYEFSVMGALAAFVLGLLLDMSSGVVLGPWAGSYVLVYVLFAFLSQRLFIESRVVAMLVVICATLCAGAAFLLLAVRFQSIAHDDFFTLAGQSFFSALCTPPLFAILSRVWRREGAVSMKRGSVVSAV